MTPQIVWDSFVVARASARWLAESSQNEWRTRSWVSSSGEARRVFVTGRLQWNEADHEVTVQLGVVSSDLSDEWPQVIDDQLLQDTEGQVARLLYSRARAAAIATAAVLEIGISPPYFEGAASITHREPAE